MWQNKPKDQEKETDAIAGWNGKTGQAQESWPHVGPQHGIDQKST